MSKEAGEGHALWRFPFIDENLDVRHVTAVNPALNEPLDVNAPQSWLVPRKPAQERLPILWALDPDPVPEFAMCRQTLLCKVVLPPFYISLTLFTLNHKIGGIWQKDG